MEAILDDKREIESLSCDLSQCTWKVGRDGVTKIEAYGEPGHMAAIIWFAVWIRGELAYRMDGHGKTVSYALKGDK